MDESLRNLVANCPTAIARLDRQGRTRFANPAFEMLVGVPDERWQARIREVFETESPCELELALAGARRLVVRLVPETADTILAYAHAEERAAPIPENDPSRLALAMQLARIGVWDWDIATDVTVWNDEMLRIYGVRREHFTGKGADYIAFTRADYRESQGANIATSFARGFTEAELATAPLAFAPKELCIVRPDGEERFTIGDAITILDDHHLPIRMLGVTIDVTEQKRAERLQEQLQQAHKLDAVGRLAGGVAHDFNNLLSVITACSQLWLAKLGADHPMRADLEAIQSAGDRGAALTRRLLAFGRAQIVHAKVLDLAALVGEFEPLIRPIMREDVALVLRLPASPVYVAADPSQLGQVIMNLVVNARDAMRDGGTLTIEVAASPDATLTVTDTGAGFDDEVRRRMFEPFFTTKAPGHGTGLGLATVHGIVQQSGGTVEAHGRPGHGATFVVRLPACAPEPVVASTGEVDRAAPTGATVLVVEDDDAVRRIVVRTLQAAGLHVIDAACAADAIRAFEAAPRIDILVSDVVMPVTSGSKLARELRARVPGLPVLFLSGHAADDTIERDLREPHTVLVAKPFVAEDLVERIRSMVQSVRVTVGSRPGPCP